MKKYYIREKSLLWRLIQIAVCTVGGLALMLPVLLLANLSDAISNFFLGLL